MTRLYYRGNKIGSIDRRIHAKSKVMMHVFKEDLAEVMAMMLNLKWMLLDIQHSSGFY